MKNEEGRMKNVGDWPTSCKSAVVCGFKRRFLSGEANSGTAETMARFFIAAAPSKPLDVCAATDVIGMSKYFATCADWDLNALM